MDLDGCIAGGAALQTSLIDTAEDKKLGLKNLSIFLGPPGPFQLAVVLVAASVAL